MMVPGSGPQDQHGTDRERLQADLLSAVKQCQTRFGGRSELATELDPHVVYLCTVLELVLGHGLKSKKSEKKQSAIRQVTDLVCGNSENLTLWITIRSILTHHERERYEMLRHVWTDRGRGRAWLRSALNEHSLERYLIALLQHEDLPLYYEHWAFMCDQEANSILTNMAAGLGSILFAMNIDKPELNHAGHFGGLQAVKAEINEHVIQDPPPIPVKKKQENKRSNTVGNIISFDEDNLDESPTSQTSGDLAPVSSLPTIGVQLQDGDADVGIECAEEATNEICEIDLSNSDTEQILENECASMNTSTGLRPVNNANVGELIPVPVMEETHSSEDSVSVPSFSEDNEAGVSAVNSDRSSLESVSLEALQKELGKLKKNLEQVSDINVTLRSQIVQANHYSQQKQQENETKIQELNRENELLKHQLRKYVSAVQMLRQDSQSGQEDENIFEQKLVQVAEMHGELMELNERLQRNLIGKEGIIRRLYMEIEALRGPLGPTEVDIHTQIISLWVPSVFLTGSTKPYHVYQVHIRIADEEWNVYRRYAQFYILHKEIKKQYPVISAFQFPPKKTIGNKDAKFVEDRRLKLQQYLRRLLNHMVANTSSLANAPTKSLLISVIPFLGEQNEPSLRKPSPKASVPRVQNSPQYSGL